MNLLNSYKKSEIKSEKLNDRLLVKAKLIIARDDFVKGNLLDHLIFVMK